MKKKGYVLLASGIGGGTLAALMAMDLGSDVSPLAKIFIAFFGAILVLQIIPAAVLFGCMIKGMLFWSADESEPELAVESQSENRLR